MRVVHLQAIQLLHGQAVQAQILLLEARQGHLQVHQSSWVIDGFGQYLIFAPYAELPMGNFPRWLARIEAVEAAAGVGAILV